MNKNNNLWQKVIEEEMEKLKTAVAESTTSPENLAGYQEIDFHMIFLSILGKT